MLKITDYDEIWNEIKREFAACPRDVRTRPLGNREPVWFFVSCTDNKVMISNGRTHGRKSVIHGARTLKREELEAIFDLYQRRKTGESVSLMAKEITQNQVYWYGIFAELGY